MASVKKWFTDRGYFLLHHFLAHFCYYLPLPLVLLLVAGLLTGRVGGGYGVRHLIFHDDPLKQAVAGFTLTVLCVECLLVGFLLEYGRGRRVYRGRFAGYAVQTVVWTVLCALVVYGAARFLGLAVGWVGGGSAGVSKDLDEVDRLRLPFPPPWQAVPLAVGAVAGVAYAAAVFLACRGPKPAGGTAAGGRIPPGDDAPEPVPARSAAPAGPSHYVFIFWMTVAAAGWYFATTYVAHQTGHWWGVRPELPFGLGLGAALAAGLWFGRSESRKAMVAEVRENLRFNPRLVRFRYHLVALVFTGVTTVLLIVLSQAEDTASPVPAVCAVLVAAVGVYGFLTLVVRRGLAILVAGVLFVLAVAGFPPYKFRYPGLDYYRDNPDNARADGLLDVQAQLERDRSRQEQLTKFVQGLESDAALKQQREGIDKLVEERKQVGGKKRDKLKEEIGAAERVLRGLEFQHYLNTFRGTDKDGNVDKDETWAAHRFTRRGVYAVHDPRAGAPLERGAEEYWVQAEPADAKAPADVPVPGGTAGAVYLKTVAPGRLRLLRMSDIRHVKSPGKKKPLVLVTVSGGGLRSAAWTLRVLQELELRLADGKAPQVDDFPGHIRIIAGASGGMLGAGYYTATLTPPGERKTGAARAEEMRQQYAMLTADHLTPIVNAGVYTDLPLFLSPTPIRHDRGQVLEESWTRHLRARPDDPPEAWGGPLAQTFDELRDGEVAGWRPSLIFSPMLVEDGRRLLVSNLDLRWVASNDGALLGGNPADPERQRGFAMNYSQEAFELFRLFPDARRTFRLSTATRMSASFPFFSPAVSLPTWPRRRVVDAGYYDNYGVSVITSWLFSGRNAEWIRENVSKVLIVQIRDGVSDEYRQLQNVEADQSTPLSRAVEEFFTPLEGLDSGRVGSASFRNDGQLEQLSGHYRELKGQSVRTDQMDRFLTTITFEFPIPASLSWYLSGREREAIDVLARGETGTEYGAAVGRRERFLEGLQDTELHKNLRKAMGQLDQRFDDLRMWWWTQP